MLLSGFTFIRNALKYDFPITECVESMLPLVDELIINVGKSDDGTEELIAKLQSPKIRIISSVWDDTKTDRGLVLSEQTNIALQACQGRWALYLQADEALHEGEHAAIRRAVEQADQNPDVDGLRLRYLHFYGGYGLVQRPWNWYPSEIRIVRKSSGARSYGDAQTFRIPERGADRELKTRLLDAHVFHYGHARAPETMARKIRYFHRFWHGDNHGIAVEKAYHLDWKSLVWYWGSHPAAYAARVAEGDAWSPNPTKVLGASEWRNVVVYATTAPQLALAAELKFLIAKQRPQSQVRIVGTLGEWVRTASADSALVDLAAETRKALAFSVWNLKALTAFKLRIAHAPRGKISRFRSRFYSLVNWGNHQTADQGFRVPDRFQAIQLGRWLGIDSK
ncbi:MAG: hypothetical protein HY074_01070 [Deltaproteobacteria bacterium]|nr:hypothetical protein [Deltaproteobacteria bacterium]